MHPAHKLIYRYLWLLIILCTVLASSPHALHAQGTTGTPMPGSGIPILPIKPTITPTPTNTPIPPLRIAFLIASSYTAPQQVRAQEPFELHLEIKNNGNGMVNGYTIRAKDCATAELQVEGACVKPLPNLAPGQSAWVTFRLRLITKLTDQDIKQLGLQIADSQSNDLKHGPDDMTVKINFLPARSIADETPDLKRPFPGPDITVGRTWTAKARSTVAELLTPVPVRLGGAPGGGGYEFELVVELHNQGQVEATNIFVDFCGGENIAFHPVGSTCRKFVPASLPAGAKAIASQTLAYKNDATPAARGEQVTLSIAYEFWYVEQWLKGAATPTVYIYPQEYPAPLLPPYAAAQLLVNTEQLNVRLGPGTNYPWVGVIRRGEVFDVIGRIEDAGWWQIIFDGRAAWVSGQAAYVTVRGGENVPVALSTPPPPVARPPASAAEEARSDPTEQVAGSSAITATATLTPTTAATATPESVSHLTAQSRSADAPAPSASSADVANLSSRLAKPWVVIERYRTVPQPITDGQPFTLELTLRNPGRQTASQLVVGWRSNQIAPFGAGNMRWLGDLLPGATVTLSGQFLVTDPRPLGVLQLPVEFSYSDDAGQAHTARDEITLLRPTPRPPTDTTARSAATPTTNGRPLWLSALLGFLGLGGQSR